MKYFHFVLSNLIIIFFGQWTFAQSQHEFLVKKVNLVGVPLGIDFNSMLQDDDGFLWLGSLSGLFRYDGTKITRFLRDPADSNSLTHNYASTLVKDRSGNIWIGTFGGFVNRYNRVIGKIERIEPAVKNAERSVVRKTIISSDGNIMAATAQAIYKINPGGRVSDSILIPAAEPMKNAAITDIVEHEKDQYLITATTGVFLVDWKQRKMLPVNSLPAGLSYTCIGKDKNGNYWSGSNTIFFVIKKDLSFAADFIDHSSTSLVGGVSCMQLDRTGRMWIGSANGLFFAEKKKITKVCTNSDTLSHISSLLIDKQQIVWVQAGRNLYQVFKPAIIFQTIPGVQALAKNQLIQSILEEKPGYWNIGTRHGLHRYSFSSGKFEEIIITANKENKPWIGAQLIDRNNGYWVGTWGQGVFYREPGATSFTQFTSEAENENSLSFNTTVALAEDKDANIWIGSFNSGNQSGQKCLSYYDPLSKKIHRVNGTAAATSFKSISISQIEKDENQNMWIGSWDIGLSHYNGSGVSKEKEKFVNYSEASSYPQRISHNVVSCIRPGTNHKIWFGTISGGLNMFDTRTHRNQWFTIKDGLASNLIYRVEEDDNGIIWMSTDNGISRFDTTTKSFINYNTTSGLPANNFAFLTSIKCADGTIAFGTNDGQVVYFNPNTSKNLINTRPVVITDIRLFNKSLETGDASLLKKAAYLTDTLRLQYDHSVISFELSNMDFLNPEIYTYAYKLEGFDKDWTYITDRNSITYTNLDPGVYTLLVKNANHLGAWNEKPTELILIIKPPYWQTWWFISLIILAIAALIYVLFRYRLQQKLRVFQVRNRLHRDLHDDVGATLSSVKAYSEILKDNPNNPVIAELIKDNSTEMLDRLEVISWATNPQHDHFKSLKSMMMKYAAPLCHSKNIEFNIESKGIHEEMIMPGEVRQNIYLIFKEGVNNMIKYAEATRCDIKLSTMGNQFVLQIVDNGKGFNGIFKGTGSGWKNMKKRTADLNGKLEIESNPANGTDIRMHLPYPFKIPNSWDAKRS